MNRLLRRSLASALAIALAAGIADFSPAVAADPPAEQAAAAGDELRGLLRDGRYAEVEQAAGELLARAEADRGADSLEAAEALMLLGAAHRGLSRYDEALASFRRAYEIRIDKLGEDHVDTSSAIQHLATALLDRGSFEEASESYRRALAIRTRLHGPEHELVAESIKGLAMVQIETGQYDDARAFLERALAMEQKLLGADHDKVVGTKHRLASLLKDTGDYAASHSMFLEVLDALEARYGAEHPRVIAVLNMLGIVTWRTGSFEAAEKHFARALELTEKLYGPDHILVAKICLNWGNQLVNAGDVAAARPLYERSLAVAERVLGADHPDLAHPLNNLSQLLLETGEYDDARPLIERALELRERALGAEHPFVAATVDNLAGLHMLTGKHDAAEPLYERALATRREVYGPEHPLVAESLQHRAVFRWLGRRDGRGALESALQAEAIARLQFQRTAGGLTESHALQFEQIRVSGLDLAMTVLASLDERARTQHATRIARTWDQLVHSRALVLDEMAWRHRTTVQAASAELRPLVEHFGDARERLAELVLRGPGGDSAEAYRVSLERAQGERDRAELALAERSQPFREARRRRNVGGTDVLSALPAGAALVSFVQYGEVRFGRPPGSTGAQAPPASRALTDDPAYLAFVVRPGARAGRVVPLGKAAEIEPLIEAWRRQAASRPPSLRAAARRAESAYREAATRLRQQVWDPVAAELGDVERVFVVPDGALHLVNLASLPDAEGGYLVESGPLLHHVSTERDLLRGDGGRVGSGLLALGGPDFDTVRRGLPPEMQAVPAATAQASASAYRSPPAGCAALADLRFDPLRAAGSEAREIAALWGGQAGGPDAARMLSGAWASEASFKQLAPGRRVLHVATHGFFAQDRCASTLERARDEGGRSAGGASGPADSPLLLSGLALAGANLRGEAAADREDGILSAEEIASLDLSGVQWVVLSACETGVGRVQVGEGVLGMRRAFEVAGAGTLIMSLWRVEDEATREWMHRLYERRLAGSTTAEAVREATRAMIRARRDEGKSTHPFAWGAFVAAGDWR